MQSSPLTAEVPLDEIKVFAEGLDHPECVCWHSEGCLYAGGEAGQIYRISGDGKHVEEIARTGGFLLGLAVSPDGTWLAACDLVKKCLWKFELSTGALTVLSLGSDNASFQVPNHLVFDRGGNLLVSDSGSPSEINGRILRVAPTGATTVWHNGPFHFANGLALAPAGDALFVVCTFAGSVERVAIGPDGAPAERSTYLTLDRVLPDGVAFDPAGDLYVTCYTPSRIYRVRHGEPPQVSLFADDWTDHQLCHPTNVCFGGSSGSTLYAANLGRWHISSIDVRRQR